MLLSPKYLVLQALSLKYLFSVTSKIIEPNAFAQIGPNTTLLKVFIYFDTF